MKHKLLLYGLSAAVAGTIIWACQRERIGGEDPGAVEPTLTVAEARDFFEYQYSETLPYRTKLSADRPTGLMPGDFTPLWDKARIGANREMDGADVPIDPRFVFVAVFDRLNERGDTVRQRVEATQKLVVKKWRETEEYEAFCYIATIVPTPEHYARQKNIEKEFRYAGSKGRFSGFVFYQTLRGELVAATSYREGQPTRHAYFPQITPENADSVATVMDDLTGPVSIQGLSARFKGDQEDPLIADEVIVTGSQNRPWHITITIQPSRPTGLPTGSPDPGDISYVTPYVPSGGGGGSTSLQGRPTSFTNDCRGDKTTIKAAAGNLLNIMKQTPSSAYGSPTFNDFMNRVQKNSSVEHAMVLKTDFHSNVLYFGDIRSAAGPNDFIQAEGNPMTTAIIHSHPTGHPTPPSPLDAWDLGDQLANGNGDVQANFVVVGKDIYCLQVTDSEKAKAFSAANPIPDKQSMFSEDTPAGKFWKEGELRMSSLSNDDKFSATMTYVLSRADAGIVLLRMQNGRTTFEALGVTTNSKGQYYPTVCR